MLDGMSTTLSTSTRVRFPEGATVSELLDHFDGISPQRIVFIPVPGTATEADVTRLAQAEPKRLCELIDGVLVEKVMGYPQSLVALQLAIVLGIYLREHSLGRLSGEAGMIRLRDGQVRMPDLAFISWERLGTRELPTAAILDRIPELVVEVISPSNTDEEMARKRREYFDAGVIQVWEIDPRARTVHVFTGTSEEDQRQLGEDDTLDGADVLPGFTVDVRELFT